MKDSEQNRPAGQNRPTGQNRQEELNRPAAQKKHIDPSTTVIPMAIILMLCVYFVTDPEGSTAALAAVRFFLGDTLGSYYLVVGLGVLIVSFYLSDRKSVV